MTIEFRELRTAAELAPMPVLESRVWGDVDLVAVNLLVATISEGGMAIGAFDGDRLVGSVYGFATHQPHVLHSHYLAVDPDYRRTGLGVALKHRQREWCLANGRTAMRWTFDPLQLGNAHLNLRSLGAIGVQYHADLYGPMGGINGRMPSDRLVIEWQLVGERFTPAPNQSRSPFRRSLPEQIAAAAPVAHRRPHRAARRTVAVAGRRLAGDRRRPSRPHLHPQPLTFCFLPSITASASCGKHLADLGRQPVAVGAVELAQVGPIPSPVARRPAQPSHRRDRSSRSTASHPGSRKKGRE